MNDKELLIQLETEIRRTLKSYLKAHPNIICNGQEFEISDRIEVWSMKAIGHEPNISSILLNPSVDLEYNSTVNCLVKWGRGKRLGTKNFEICLSPVTVSYNRETKIFDCELRNGINVTDCG